MDTKIVTVVGGTGFVGRYVTRRLARAGYVIRVVSRHPDGALRLKTAGHVGQVVPVQGDLARPDSLTGRLDRSHAVVSLAGILFERGRQKFSAVHAQGPERLAQMARAAGVKRFVHVSALGVDKASGSRYARSKVLGEKAVLAAFPDATILRPSVIFGPEDNFLNLFARMAMQFPALPLIGGGRTRFQPVYVDDVARAVEIALTRDDAKGQIYELGGPKVYTFREILEYVMRVTGRDRALMNLPFGLAAAAGAMGELLPRPMLTRDQVRLLRYDNVVGPNAKAFAQLGIEPTAMEVVTPQYLARFARHGKAAA